MARKSPHTPEDLLARAEALEHQANKMKRNGDRSSEQKLRRKADKYLDKAAAAA